MAERSHVGGSCGVLSPDWFAIVVWPRTTNARYRPARHASSSRPASCFSVSSRAIPDHSIGRARPFHFTSAVVSTDTAIRIAERRVGDIAEFGEFGGIGDVACKPLHVDGVARSRCVAQASELGQVVDVLGGDVGQVHRDADCAVLCVLADPLPTGVIKSA